MNEMAVSVQSCYLLHAAAIGNDLGLSLEPLMVPFPHLNTVPTASIELSQLLLDVSFSRKSITSQFLYPRKQIFSFAH